MSTNKSVNGFWNPRRVRILLLSLIGLGGLLILLPLTVILVFLFAMTSFGSSLMASLKWLLALNTVQIWWYITRAAGLVAYLLLWLSTAWGLAVTSKIFDPLLQRHYTYDFHQFISLLAIGFLALHISVLVLDQYLPFSVTQVLVPFTSTYRPLWVGIGVISLYLTILVTVTFYMRRMIGMRAFRLIHTLSLVAFLGATLHGLYAGTDSPLLSMQLVYKGALLSVIFLTAYWLITLVQARHGAAKQASIIDR
jgi:methionine sulfoxide reductase heme-binding subunit